VVRALRTARIGFLGHTYPGMLDMYSDFTQHHAQLGLHVEVLEMDDQQACVDAVTDDELETVLTETRAMFELDTSVTTEGLTWAARIAAGMDRLVRQYRLNALAYYYRGRGAFQELGAGLILGGSRLTARGIPCAGEGDLKNAVAMLILDRLGAGGSYTEFYAMDLTEGFVLMGHDGPGHLAISDRRPILRGLGLYHGKAGHGVSVEFNVKTGPVTILGCTQTADGQLKFLAAEGESLPGEILRIGNTNSRLRFALPPDEFVDRWCQEGPTHHVALGIGHQARILEKVGQLLGLKTVVVR
jgi:L-arabinose isomerase